MQERLQNLLAQWREGDLSPDGQAELLVLVQDSEECRRAATQDRLIDRLLLELQKPALDAEKVLRALTATPDTLAAKTLATIEGRPPVWRGLALSIRRCVEATMRFTRTSHAGLVWSAAVSLFLLLALGAWLFFRPASAVDAVIGEFAAVVGTPKFQHHGKPSTLNPQLSTLVYLGDRIETGDADKAELVFKDGTTLRLNFNTIIEFPTFNLQPSTLNLPLVRPPEINLLRGQIWTKVQKLTNAPRYAIRTEAATAVARGTEFGVKLLRLSATNSQLPISTAVLTVKEGAVDFSNSLGSAQATAMTESIATPDSAPSQPVPLKTIKEFEVAPYKRMAVQAQGAVLDQNTAMFPMVYPQGWAGLYIRSTPDEQDAAARQMRIVRVWPGSPAEQAGLAVGDVINQVNGQSVTNLQQVLAPIFQRQGASVDFSVLRGGLSRTVSLVTTNHPYALPLSDMPADRSSDIFDATWPLIAAGCQDVISSNQWSKLEQQFRSVLDRRPGVAALHNNLGVWYGAKEKVGPAIQQFNQAIAAEPSNPLYHHNLSGELRRIGNFERYAEEAEAVVTLAPDWVPGIKKVAEAYTFLGRQDDALAALERGLAANPSCADLWSAKAFVLFTSQRLDEALAAALKAAELEPSFGAWFGNLGSIYWARGQQQESEAAGRKAIQLDPGNATAYDGLAVIIIARLGGRLPVDPTHAQPEELAIDLWKNRPAEELAIIAEAERMERKAIALQPDYAGAQVNLGQILLERGAVDEAEPILRKAIQLDPNGPAAGVYRTLACKFAVWGIRLDEALQFALHAVQLAPSGYTFDALAMVHFRRGEYDQAEVAWKKCIELGGARGDPEASFQLGGLYERQNRPDAAVAAYQEALRLRPDYPEASRSLDKLRR